MSSHLFPFSVLWLLDEKMWMNSWSEPVLQPTSTFPNSTMGKWQLECKSEQPEGSPNLQQCNQAMEIWKEKSKENAGDKLKYLGQTPN